MGHGHGHGGSLRSKKASVRSLQLWQVGESGLVARCTSKWNLLTFIYIYRYVVSVNFIIGL